MKSTLIALALLITVFGLAPAAISSDTAFDNKEYLQGEAGVIGPIDSEARENVIVSVPMKVWLGDRDNFYQFTEEKSTNLSGPAPDFNRDYLVGEGGLVNPIESHME